MSHQVGISRQIESSCEGSTNAVAVIENRPSVIRCVYKETGCRHPVLRRRRFVYCNEPSHSFVLMVIVLSLVAFLSTGAVLATAVQPGECSAARRFAQGPGRILFRSAALSTRFHGRRCRVLRKWFSLIILMLSDPSTMPG